MLLHYLVKWIISLVFRLLLENGVLTRQGNVDKVYIRNGQIYN